MTDSRPLTDAENELLEDYLFTKGQAKKYGDDASMLRDRFLACITDDDGLMPERVEYNDRLAANVRVVHSERIDSQKLRDRYPDIFRQFAKTTTSIRLTTV